VSIKRESFGVFYLGYGLIDILYIWSDAVSGHVVQDDK